MKLWANNCPIHKWFEVRFSKKKRCIPNKESGTIGFFSSSVQSGRGGDLARSQKAFVGVVDKPGMTYNIQENFYKEGFFSIKTTLIRAKICLMEKGMGG